LALFSVLCDLSLVGRAGKRESHAGPILWHISRVSSNGNPSQAADRNAPEFRDAASVVARLMDMPAIALSA
jgi:hypothetical protein